MTCGEIDEFLDSGRGALENSREVIEHLGRCGECRSLRNALSGVEEHARPAEIRLKRIQARMVESLRPVHPLPASRFLLFLCAIIFLSIVAIGAMSFEMAGWGALSLLQRTSVFIALAASATLMGISMIGQMTPGSKQVVAPLVLPIVIPAVLLFVLVAAFRPQTETDFVGNGSACLIRGLSYAIPGAILFLVILRRGAILYPTLIGAAAGGLAGMIGLGVLEINCPNLNVFHIVTWHGGLVAVGSLAGAMTGAGVEHMNRRNFSRPPANKKRRCERH